MSLEKIAEVLDSEIANTLRLRNKQLAIAMEALGAIQRVGTRTDSGHAFAALAKIKAVDDE